MEIGFAGLAFRVRVCEKRPVVCEYRRLEMIAER
jgi:hypothetical protein